MLAHLAEVAVVALLGLFGSTSIARADAAAGRAAYDKGDYSRAAAEWQREADRNDADAELGIGSLYEFGLGDLPQDYKKASYWYQKAAAQGNTEAEYRLALIWAAGSESLRRDLVEAYKWVLLATGNKGVWSSVAADLKSQLDEVLRLDQKVEAKKRADAWKQTLTALSDVASPEAPAAPAVPAAPAKATATGCPGWPFPTLPCTEQPPPFAQKREATAAVPAAPTAAPRAPALVATPPLEQLNSALTQIDCAALRARTSPQGAPVISGTVPDAEQRARVVQAAARLFPNSRADVNVDIVPPPLCRSLSELDAMRLTGLVADNGLGLRLAGGKAELREGDPIKVEVRGPADAVNLRIDYFSLDGQVLHLWPNSQDLKVELAARETRVFGNAASGKTWNAGGAPFGTEVISALATPRPLDLGGLRPDVEPAADYLRDVERALQRSPAPPGTTDSLTTLLVKTRGR